MSQMNPYVDEPSQSQKLYGANLPPSLRWGAARKHAEVYDQESFPRVDTRTGSYTRRPEYAFYRKRGQKRNVTADGKKDYVMIRDERPNASSGSDEDDTESLLQEIPQQEPHTVVPPLGHSDDEKGNLRVQDWIEETKAKTPNDEERVGLGVHDERIEAPGTRNHHATVEDADEDGNDDSRVPVIAEAEDGGQDAPSSSSPQRSEKEEESRHGRERHIDVDDAARASDFDKQHRIKRPTPHVPVYAKINVKYISTETLRYYDIPWKYDADPNYIILFREMPKEEINVLFAHTRHLREGRARWKKFGILELKRTKPPWFQRCWSAQPAEMHTSQDHVTGRHGGRKVLLEGNAIKSPLRQRISSWRQTLSLVMGEPVLRRVVHATYGDLLQNNGQKSSNPPGFIAVPQLSGSQGETLYHVLHLRQDNLDFEAFKHMIVNLPELYEVSDSINAHLSQAQRLYEQSPNSGNAMRGMNGFCHHTSASAGQVSMTLINMPFLQLREHAHRTETKLNPMAILNQLLGRTGHGPEVQIRADTHPHDVHPTRTLFQYLNPRDSSRRDLKQVVCQMLGPADRRYLCVSQVWILIVDEELMVTCSSLSESDMYDGLQLKATAQLRPPKRSLVNIHVESEDGRQWLLDSADCLTYLDFAAHFSDITHHFPYDFKIYLDDQELQAHDWTSKIHQTHSSTVRLRLERVISASDRNGSIASGESIVFRVEESPLRRDISERLAQIEWGAPLCGAGDDKNGHLDKLFRGFVAKLRQHQQAKHEARQLSTIEEVAGISSGANSPASEIASGASNASESKGSKISRSGDSDSTTSKDDARSLVSFQSSRLIYPEDSVSQVIASNRHIRDTRSESSQAFDPIFSLPKSATQARVLACMGIPFEEEPEEFVVASGLDEMKLFAVMQLTQKFDTLDKLRGITYDSLGFPAEGIEQEPVHAPATEAVPQSLPGEAGEPVTAEAGLFSENKIYKACPRMSRDELRKKLMVWKCESISVATVNTDGAGFSPPLHTRPFCNLLGYSRPKVIEAATGLKVMVDLQRSLVLDVILHGLRLLVNTSRLIENQRGTQAAEEKLLAAVFALIKALHQSLERAAEPLPEVFLGSLFQSCGRLFEILNVLDTHALTIEMLHHLGGSAASAASGQHKDVLKHLVTSFLLASTALTEIEGYGVILQAEAVRRPWSRDRSSSVKDYQLHHDRVKEACSMVYGLDSVIEASETADAQQQLRFDQSIDRLEELGWDREAASIVLRNECRWNRVTHHADCAAQILESSFEAALCADPAKKIQWKAAAFPKDLVALLLSRLLWRPVLDGQDALDMYNRYATDLETNILTGEPSRELLDRIRYLRHELNAFSQVQREQIDMLGQITRALLPSDGVQDHLPNDPHPRRAVFATLPKGVKIQNDIVQLLSGMLDGLQSEARAQITGLQDWRDNAAVVFTIISVIFLPLSFIASVFGMNTADVRNMAQSQWVFWISASSFTIIVILITVYFVDVPPLWRWLERKADTNSKNSAPPRPDQNIKSPFFTSLARQSEEMTAVDSASGLHTHRIHSKVASSSASSEQ